ncbi:uncharacterized protein LOC128547549 [Mercenaria mercenaria]|uniref:uncharacterized protein LOC128547549 n=1 Tax=Mercenaria mercenaria TaxID=6596 RepID=UPI00234F1565|nr:uncharacterized protein LOC128547549 [Mercenaria mercenaria]
MTYFLNFFCIFVVANVICADDFYFGTFPSDFEWGLSASVYKTGANGNYSANERLQDDIKGLQELGVKTFRFTPDWKRLSPGATGTNLHGDTVQFYSLLIEELQRHGIEPHITLFDADIPEKIQADGGWINDNRACDLGKTVFSLYGDKVLTDTWSLILEICFKVYARIPCI